jgi:phosphoglycolate phosphatase
MQYFFFDIDGTLLLSGGAGRVAMTQVMSEMFQLTTLKQIKVHGRTDRGIIADLFSAHQLPHDPVIHTEFTNRYHRLLPDSMHQCEGTLMPGVVPLLETLSQRSDVKLGILTGNSRSAAWTKLKHFQLDRFFEFGGYGEHHANRNDVAQEALDQCRNTYPEHQVEPGHTWVVGDTANDITCARSIGANVAAVATGGADLQTLKQHQPDLLLPDLANHAAFLEGTRPAA